MIENSNNQNKKFDLEERTKIFAKRIREFVRELPKGEIFYEDINQLVRSSGSVGANYIEANESLSKKDFVMRVKICRKEAKESIYWLGLIAQERAEKQGLIKEATELMRIFGAIITKIKL